MAFTLSMELVDKFVEMDGCLTFPVTMLTISMETVARRIVASKADTNAGMELPQPHQFVNSVENILDLNLKESPNQAFPIELSFISHSCLLF